MLFFQLAPVLKLGQHFIQHLGFYRHYFGQGHVRLPQLAVWCRGLVRWLAGSEKRFSHLPTGTQGLKSESSSHPNHRGAMHLTRGPSKPQRLSSRVMTPSPSESRSSKDARAKAVSTWRKCGASPSQAGRRTIEELGLAIF